MQYNGITAACCARVFQGARCLLKPRLYVWAPRWEEAAGCLRLHRWICPGNCGRFVLRAGVVTTEWHQTGAFSCRVRAGMVSNNWHQSFEHSPRYRVSSPVLLGQDQPSRGTSQAEGLTIETSTLWPHCLKDGSPLYLKLLALRKIFHISVKIKIC